MAHGISQYLGEALLLADGGQLAAGDPQVTSAVTRTRATGGSIVLVLTDTGNGIRFAVQPVNP